MLTFLRKLRMSLIQTGKIPNYIVYALGEIGLVVIGILIALQINNWNEWKIDRRTEENYLIRLSTDLRADSLYFSKRLMESEKEVANYYDYIHKAYSEEQTVHDYIELQGLLYLSSEQMTIQSSTYQEMINAGHINLIRNNSLKVALINIYRKYDSVSKHFEEINAVSASQLQAFANSSFYFKYHPGMNWLFDKSYMLEGNEWEWVNHPDTETFKIAELTVGFYALKHNVFIGYFEEMIKDINQVLGMINQELVQAGS